MKASNVQYLDTGWGNYGSGTSGEISNIVRRVSFIGLETTAAKNATPCRTYYYSTHHMWEWKNWSTGVWSVSHRPNIFYCGYLVKCLWFLGAQKPRKSTVYQAQTLAQVAGKVLSIKKQLLQRLDRNSPEREVMPCASGRKTIIMCT